MKAGSLIAIALILALCAEGDAGKASKKNGGKGGKKDAKNGKVSKGLYRFLT